MTKNIYSFFIDNLLLVLVYYFSADLSVHFLSVPPSHAVAIWPPTGISLAAVLLRGYRVLPAIFIADLIVAIEIVGFSDFVGSVFSLAVGFQAMVTAWIGAYLVRHFIGVDNPLIDNQSIILFLFLGGPVSLVLPSAFALGVEYWLGMLESSDLLIGFLTWWLGGTIGVIIFAPLVLIVFGGQIQRSRIVSIIIPLSFLFVLLVYLFVYTKNHEHQRLRRVFDWKVQVLHKETVSKIDEMRHELQGMKAFAKLAYPLNQKKIADFSRYVLAHNPEITALAWVPRITSEKRTEFESKIGKSLFKQQQKGETIKSALKTEYFAIEYIESLENYHALIGLDFVSRQQIKQILGTAEIKDDTEALMVATTYLQNKTHKFTVLIMPVIKEDTQVSDEHLKGYVALFLPFHSVLNHAVELAKNEQINLNIAGLGINHDQVIGRVESHRYEIKSVDSIRRFGIELSFTYFPSDHFVLSHGSLPIGWVFILGLGVTGLVGFTLLSVTGQTAQTQKIVEQRTKDLFFKQQLLQTVFDSVQEGIVACDEKGKVTFFNHAAEKICGEDFFDSKPERWQAYFKITDLHGIALLSELESPFNQLLSVKKVRDFEFSLIAKDNLKKILKMNSAQVLNQSGQMTGAVASFQNITRQKQVLDELKKLSWAVEYSPASILMTDKNGNIEYVNSKFVEMTGYSAKEVEGKNPAFLSAGKTDKKKYKHLWKTILSGNEWRGDFLNRKKNSHYYWSKQLIAPIADEQHKITHFVAIQEDVTEEREAEKLLSYQASHDELTGLLNRRECEKRLDRVIHTARIQNSKHVFCFLDLDKFKIVNDSCGHKAGDYLLLEVCELFKKQLRQRDFLIRLGGDEFGIIMEHCSIDQAVVLANRICQLIADYEFDWEGRLFKIGVSIGLVEINEKVQGYSEIVSQADEACYAAKKAGRGQVCVYGKAS